MEENMLKRCNIFPYPSSDTGLKPLQYTELYCIFSSVLILNLIAILMHLKLHNAMSFPKWSKKGKKNFSSIMQMKGKIKKAREWRKYP